MFRSTGVLSFAHAAFATAATFLYYDFTKLQGWPAPLAALIALVLTVAYGLLVERFVIRYVRTASTSTKLIATLGVVALTTGLVLWHYGFDPVSVPWLFGQESFGVLEVNITYQQLVMLGFAGVSALGLGWFLQQTRFGIAVRAVAQNAESARLMGVSLLQVSRFNWALGAFLAGLTGILTGPLATVNAGSSVLLLVKALTGTLFGGLSSLTLSFAGGIAVGVVQAITTIISTAPGVRDLATMLMVVALLLLRRSWASDVQDTSVAAVKRRIRLLPESWKQRLREIEMPPSVRGALRPAAYGAIVGMALLAIVMPIRSNTWAFIGANGLFITIEALSLVLLVGWGGQVSLMQGAYVGIGAFSTAYLTNKGLLGLFEDGMPLEMAIPLAALSGVALGTLVGLPALRLSGLQFGIASLAFAGAASEWLFQLSFFPRDLPRSELTLFGADLFNDQTFYFMLVPVTLVLYLFVWNLRRSTYGALLISARDASSTVAHFGADPKRTRMGAFMLASFIAAMGGAFQGLLLSNIQPLDFSLLLSMALLLYAVVGGLQSLAGPLVAGIMFGVMPQVVQRLQGASSAEPTAIPDIVAGLVVLALVALRPDGLASLFRRRRSAHGGTDIGSDSHDAAVGFSPPIGRMNVGRFASAAAQRRWQRQVARR